MNDKETKVPIYIAIIVALILIAAAGYYVLGSNDMNSAPEEKNKPATNGDTYPYYYADRGNGIITVMVHGSPTAGSSNRDFYINPLEDGYAKLKSKCNVVSREVLAAYEGRTVAYSVTVEGMCNPN